MRQLVVLFVVLATFASAQAPAPAATSPAASSNIAPVIDLPSLLNRIDQAAQSAAVQIASLRIEKWKTDGEYKHQAQANADSLQRNMTAALPALTNAARNTPQSLEANFKLYRNLNALTDVMKTLAESAGAFGPKQEYQQLADSAATFDETRRALGDYFETLTASKEAEITRLKAAAAGPPPVVRPKKVIVDNDPEPALKPKKKKH
jgi:hypothetical protein